MPWKTTRFPRGLTIGGGATDATTASAVVAMRGSFDPTSSTQVLLGTLPKGARVVDVVGWGGSTGGTNPTVDIGTAGTTDGFANELQSDSVKSAVAAGKTGTLVNTSLTADTPVYGKVGASAATGGTVAVTIFYMVEDL